MLSRGRIGRISISQAWPWIVVIAVGIVWAWLQLRDTYFFYDEWSMIDRAVRLPAREGMMASFNGHLWMLEYWLYRAQVVCFGVDDHTFIAVLFVGALAALHLGLATLFRVSGIPLGASLLIGGLLTYFGVSPQTFIFAVEISLVLTLAISAAAAAIVLAGPPTALRSIVVGTLMLACVGIDSATALIGVPFVTVIVVRSWRSAAALAIVPAVLALGWWYAANDLGPHFEATPLQRMLFAGRLLVRALGGLVGLGEIAGIVVLLASGAIIASAWRRREITGVPLTMLMAGTLATTVIMAGLAQARAGLPGFNFFNANRYLQSVAVPAAWALLPTLTAIGRAWLARTPRVALAHVMTRAVPALIVVAFLIGLRPMYQYAGLFHAWNIATRRAVQEAARVVRDGCPGGAAPDPASQPLGDLCPQITTSLLRELIARDALHPPATAAMSVPVDPTIVERMCPR